MLLTAILLVIVGYISGALPFGYWTGKLVKGIDIRKHGSGSTGATNVYRCVGKPAGAFVFIVDNLKGALPVLLCQYLEQHAAFVDLGTNSSVIPVLVAIAALIGHSKSIFLDWQGGKSAAVGLGTLFALNPIGGLLTMITFFSMTFLSKIVSIGSLTAVGMCAVYFYFLHAPTAYIIYCLIGFAYVTYRHKANLQRLMNGTEPRYDQKPPIKQAVSQPVALPPIDTDQINKGDSSALLQ
jgi:glycerol-3-phosphate acyltransferase PlsY